MRSLRRFLTRLLNPATRRAQDERLREEIEEHIALQLYVTQLLVNFPSWPARDLAAWLPD
jgi:hypothetical protein